MIFRLEAKSLKTMPLLTPIFQRPIVSLPVNQVSLAVSIHKVKARYIRNTPQGEKPYAKPNAQSLFFMDGYYRHFVGCRHLRRLLAF
jgi:hypothetical protein